MTHPTFTVMEQTAFSTGVGPHLEALYFSSWKLREGPCPAAEVERGQAGLHADSRAGEEWQEAAWCQHALPVLWHVQGNLCLVSPAGAATPAQ